jgi:medium-chain acyl-[acyl-carrier-protein] hydrolase
MFSKKDLYVPFPRPEAPLRLLCLPHAGGSASAYRPLASHLPSGIELVAVQLPGRGARLRETPYRDLGRLVIDLARCVRDLPDKPWMLMGHSFGCRVAFELALELFRTSDRLPLRFLAAGCSAFHLGERSTRARLSDDELLERVRSAGGTPDAVLQNKEMMTLTLPALRADFAMADSHSPSSDPLPIPATIMTGLNDESVPEVSLPAWQAYFSQRISVITFTGGHFFVDSHAHEVARVIASLAVQQTDVGAILEAGI